MHIALAAILALLNLAFLLLTLLGLHAGYVERGGALRMARVHAAVMMATSAYLIADAVTRAVWS